MRQLLPLSADLLCRRCDEALLPFDTTAELPPLDGTVGQARAIDATRFAIDMKRPGYNLFVLGEPGTGRHALVQRVLQEQAMREPPPAEWCYVNNFREPNRPRVLCLPAGRGAQLRRDMQQFAQEVGSAITAALESDEFRTRTEAIQAEYKQREEEALRELGRASGARGIALLRTPQGFVFAPMKGDETMEPDEFAQLADAEKERIGKLMDEYGEALHKLLHQFPRWRREMQARLKQVNRDAMALAVGHLIEELKERYTDLLNVLRFLDEVLEDVVQSGEGMRASERGEGEGVMSLLQRYQVNLLVDHSTTAAAPVVFEDNPNFQNLVGRIDHLAHMGTLVTNFTLIKGGALHRANGGYLMLDAAKVLTQPYAWEGLKRALKAGQVRIETLGQAFGWVSTLPMEPEPIPLNVKVVLFGERIVYYLLREYDPEFEELFKIAADFESDFDRSGENIRGYAQFVARIAGAKGLRPFERGAVARLIEHSARLAEDAEKLSARSRPISDLMQEADYWAGRAGRDRVARADVEAALKERIRRAERLRNAVQQEILRNTLLISTSGENVGQVNGLVVIDLGEFVFAHPVRITATTRVGEGDVVDIERESELGGSIHSKGVMILASFLATRYARRLPLSLAASLVFEQSYGPVEGDSASLAELCALLSSLANVAIKQSLAVTGSVNQHGAVQPIGGVNEKIEGFFDICRARGLTGDQGVVIPASNVKHLMLREDVVAAAAAGQFHIYAVEHVDEAIEILTGVAAGEPDETGLVPAGSINFLVASQLHEMSLLRQEYGGHAKPKRKRKEK
ncbi:MAG: Lon protease family protein [Pseudomonadota bacterium]|jgi:lon-related putative ATP-dependent protease